MFVSAFDRYRRYTSMCENQLANGPSSPLTLQPVTRPSWLTTLSFYSCRKAYDKTIIDKEQPLLLHRPKRRDKLNKDVSYIMPRFSPSYTTIPLSLLGPRGGDMPDSRALLYDWTD